MSSNIFLAPTKEISEQEFADFCGSLGYTPRDGAPHGYFYAGAAQIRRLRSDMIVVGTYWMGDLGAVVRVAKRIISGLPATISEHAPEFTGLL